MSPIGFQKPAKLAPLLLTTALLFFGFMVLVLGIDTMHMRPDEELTFRNMSLSFVDSMVQLAQGNNQAPLWWIQVWVWQRLGGLSEFAGRVNSILWAMLTLSLVYQMGRSWFGGHRFGWFAIAVLSVNAYFFIYALEMRMYSLGMLVVALSMRFFYAWLTKKTWQSAVMYGLSASVLLYTHYYFAFIILAQVVYFAIFHLFNWQMIRQGFIVASAAIITWLPGLIIVYGQLVLIDFEEAGGLKIPTKPTNLTSLLELAQLSSNGIWWLYAIIIAVGVILLWRKKAFWLIVTWLILSPAFVFAVNTQITIYNLRYTSFLIPAIGLIIGVVLASLPTAGFGRWLNWLVLIALCAVSLYNLQNFIPVRIPFRHIFADVSTQYEDGDAIFAMPLSTDIYLEDQYARYLPDALIDNRILNLSEAQNHRRIWFMSTDFLGDDSQNYVNFLEATHRVFYVAENSECSRDYCYIAQLMLAPPNDTPEYFGETLGFLGADIDPIENNQLPVLLWWMVDETPSADYSISLQLLADNGTLIAQVDRQIDPPEEEFGEISTSEMQAGGNYIDWRVLDLPSNLPNGDYTLQVVVYQWWDGIRLTTTDGSDAIHIRTITLNR